MVSQKGHVERSLEGGGGVSEDTKKWGWRQKRQYLRDHHGEFDSVAQGIEIMKLARGSFNTGPKTILEGRARGVAGFKVITRRSQGEFAGYGYRRLGKQLRREGIRVNDYNLKFITRKSTSFLFPSLEKRGKGRSR